MLKRILIFILFVSLGFNVYFLTRKMERIQRDNENYKLHNYKEISYKEGYDYFVNQYQNKYPESIINNKHYIVYMWDSTMYDFMYKDQMRALDSMAATYGKYHLEYVFATEMEETASVSFLKRNQADFKNIKMLYGMDDYISSLYSNKDIKIKKNKRQFVGCSKERPEKILKMFAHEKKKPFYLIMDAKGKVLYNNGNTFMILKDTLFLNSLKTVLPTNTNKAQEILN